MNDEFWTKYNRCSFCQSYTMQGNLCNNCKWKYGSEPLTEATDYDKFRPTEEFIARRGEGEK